MVIPLNICLTSFAQSGFVTGGRVVSLCCEIATAIADHHTIVVVDMVELKIKASQALSIQRIMRRREDFEFAESIVNG